MSLRTAGSVLVVFLWSVTVVLGQDGWSVFYTTQSICALKGSTVELTCSFSYPRGHNVTSTFWFTKMETEDIGQDPENAGRLEYHGNKKKDCTLRITDLRERDSATYKFIFITDQTRGRYYGDPGVTLSITGLQVKVTGGHQDKTLTCITTCTLTDNPTYIWYKNGQHLDESTSPQYKDPVSSNYEDSYSCAVKGHDVLHSPAVCVQGWSCNRVTYTKRKICALKGSTVNISCTYFSLYNITSSLWFSPKQRDSWRDELIPEDLTTDPGYAGRVEYVGEKERGHFTLRITDLREEDSAEYKFIFNTQTSGWGYSFPGTTLTVTDLQVKVTPATEAGKRTLTCSTSCTLTDNPTYIWYKNGHKVKEDTSSLYSDSFSDADSYSCAVKDHADLHSPAVCKCGLLHTTFVSGCQTSQKCWSVTYTTQSICTLKGSTVELSCSYTYPRGTVTTTFWFTKWGTGVEPKDLGQDPEYAGRLEYHGDKEKDCTLRITDLRERDSATYRFRLLTDQEGGKYTGSPGVTLSVTGLQVKNGHKVKEDTSSLYSDSFSDADSYSCAVKGHEDLHSPAVCQKCWSVTYTHQKICALKGSTEENNDLFHFILDVVLEMDPTSVSERENVTLTCRTKCTLDPITVYSWYKNGQPLPNSNTYSPVYSLFSVSSEDTGRYSCAVEGHEDLPSAEETLTVTYGPRNTSVSVSPSGEIVEGSSVTLTCSSDANPPVDKYTWYFQNETFLNGFGQIYNISNFKSKDNGHYHCEAWNGRGSRNSTALMIFLPEKQSSVLTAAVGIIVVVLVLILCLSGLMWFRKKASKSTSDTRDTSENVQGDSSPVYENISSMTMTPTAAQTAATVDQDDVHYASVHFSRFKNQEVPLYSTAQLCKPQKQEEDVQYDVVKFNCPSNSNRPTAAQAAEDSSEIYSRVNKPRRPEHNKPRTQKS
ncbi:sialoadhesin-like [Salvelinus fontinalis]|uniref:sialoadhesin-like n=1 Tax=Salvelinus fontinalis TaxID=8038 RepID=UPI002485B479|nr:sialoadhesin-like [Salvelinus fontinalis]